MQERDSEAAATEDPEWQPGRKKKFRSPDAKSDGVVIRLEADPEKGWVEEKEVHYDQLVEDRNAGRSLWECRPRAASIDQHKRGHQANLVRDKKIAPRQFEDDVLLKDDDDVEDKLTMLENRRRTFRRAGRTSAQ